MGGNEQKILALRQIDGLDVDSGLRTIANMTQAYLRILGSFAEKLPEDMAGVDSLAEQDNLEDFRIFIHGYKGLLANIGAIALSSKARNLEFAAKDNDREFIGENLPLFKELVADFAAKVQAITSANL